MGRDEESDGARERAHYAFLAVADPEGAVRVGHTLAVTLRVRETTVARVVASEKNVVDANGMPEDVGAALLGAFRSSALLAEAGR